MDLLEIIKRMFALQNQVTDLTPQSWEFREGPLQQDKTPYRSKRSQRDGECDLLLLSSRTDYVGVWFFEPCLKLWYYPEQSAYNEPYNGEEGVVDTHVKTKWSGAGHVMYIVQTKRNYEPFKNEYYQRILEQRVRIPTEYLPKHYRINMAHFAELCAFLLTVIPSQTLLDTIEKQHRENHPPKETRIANNHGMTVFTVADRLPNKMSEQFFKSLMQITEQEKKYQTQAEIIQDCFGLISKETPLNITFIPATNYPELVKYIRNASSDREHT